MTWVFQNSRYRTVRYRTGINTVEKKCKSHHFFQKKNYFFKNFRNFYFKLPYRTGTAT